MSDNTSTSDVDGEPAALKASYKQDFLASIVVFLVALPLCMGIAIASGVPVAAGLITGIVGGLVVGFISGCPLQVSGPAAGLTVIIIDVVQEYGLETLGIVVLIAGVIQVVAGLFGLGQWFRAVSPAVIKGMLAGIGVLIFASQFHVMVDDKPKHSGIENLITIPNAIAKSFDFPDLKGQESRKFRKRMLLDVGELHRRQVDLSERVAEQFPHVHDPDEELDTDRQASLEKKLPQWVSTQKAINAELEKIVGELQEVDQHVADPKKAVAVEEVAQVALQQNQRALTELENQNVESMVEAQDESAAGLLSLQGQLKNHHIAAHLGILAILSIIAWQFAPRKLQMIPGPLLAVVFPTVIAAIFILPVNYVEIPDRLWDGIHFPSLAVLADHNWLTLVQVGLMIAVVASAETLLCATAVDQMHDGQRTNYDRELFAQGIGNSICGTLGVLPMTGVIVRSSANIQAGGKTRLSAILHGFWLLLFVAALGFLLRQIPTACLAAILVYTGFKLVNFKAIAGLAKYGKSEVAIYFATVITIVCTDLLIGVSVGIGLAALKLLHYFSHLEANLKIDRQANKANLELVGAATFLRLPVIAGELERVPRAAEPHVDLRRLDYIDHACLELLMTWAKQHESTEGRLVIDWDSLHARFSSSNSKRGTGGESGRSQDQDGKDQGDQSDSEQADSKTLNA